MPEEPAVEKDHVRKELLRLRMDIGEDAYEHKSREIIRQLTLQPFYARAKTVHCYVSMNKRREVNTHALITRMMEEGKRVIVPVMDAETPTMRHVVLSDFDDLKENSWGVPEPIGGEEVAVDDIDLIVVPMAGGDQKKNRMGYGKGFYDRFLATVTCPTAGLLFESCLLKKIPVGPFDIPLDVLVTEDRVL